MDGERGKEVKGLSPEEVSRMEHELESLGREFRLIEESHGKNTVQLVLVSAYLRKVLDNTRVARYLTQHHPEVAAEFRKIAEARNPADGTPASPAVRSALARHMSAAPQSAFRSERRSVGRPIRCRPGRGSR